MTVIAGATDCSTADSLANRIFNNLRYDNPWQATQSGCAATPDATLCCPSTPNGIGYKCTAITTGITGSTEPTWPLVLGNTVVDGGVTWTATDVANPSAKTHPPTNYFSYPLTASDLDGMRVLAWNTAKAIVDSANTEMWDGATQVSGGGGGGGQTDYAALRRWGACAPTATGTATLTTWGMQALSSLGSAPAYNTYTDNRLLLLNFTSGSGTECGYAGPFTETRPLYSPKLKVHFAVDNFTNKRIWVALTSGDLHTLAPSISSSSTTKIFVGLAYDDAVSLNWLLCSSDGTHMTGIDTGVPVGAVSAGKVWRLELDWTSNVSLIATLWYTQSSFSSANQDNWIQLFSVTKTTNLSSATTALGVWCSVTNNSGTDVSFYLGSLMLEQQG